METCTGTLKGQRQRNKGDQSGQQAKAKEHPWSGQCFVNLENPHDHLAGIATVLRVGLELLREPLSVGMALVLGRGQQLWLLLEFG